MKLFIVAVPLFDKDIGVQAYEMRYHKSEKLFGISQSFESLDGATWSPGVDLLNVAGLEPFTGGKPIFLPITQYLLLTDFQTGCNVEPGLLVCSLDEAVPADEVCLGKCRDLKLLGYRIAIGAQGLAGPRRPLGAFADFVIANTKSPTRAEDVKNAQAACPGARLVLTNIDHMNVFHSFHFFKDALFQGRFYKQPVTKGVKGASPVKANAIRLMSIVQDEDFEASEVSAVIEKDAALSVALLRFINSPAIGLISGITSIQHAVAMLGQVETRKWIMAATSAYIAEDKPNEVVKLALTRARFSENLAPLFGLGGQTASVFLVGLFSLIDIILDAPMEQAVREIALDAAIRDSLTGDGPYAKVLEFLLAYEQADWDKVSYMALANDVRAEQVYSAYVESMEWYRDLLEGMANGAKAR